MQSIFLQLQAPPPPPLRARVVLIEGQHIFCCIAEHCGTCKRAKQVMIIHRPSKLVTYCAITLQQLGGLSAGHVDAELRAVRMKRQFGVSSMRTPAQSANELCGQCQSQPFNRPMRIEVWQHQCTSLPHVFVH